VSTAASVESKLRILGFQQRGKQWRGNSPFRDGSDSKGFTVTIDGPENGAYLDHASGEHGSLYDLAERLGIPRPERTPVKDTKTEYRDLQEYAERHGAPVEAFIKARWEQTTYAGRRALKFDTANGPRYRFIDGKDSYTNVSGYKSCWYGLDRATDKASKGKLPLVLVNGEASVVACAHWGIPAAAVTNSGERILSDDLLKELRSKWSNQIIIALDCDAKGRKASAELREQLSDYSTAVVDLNMGTGGDAADLCLMYGEKALSELLERATFNAPEPPLPTAAPVAGKTLGSMAVMEEVAAFYQRVQSGGAKLNIPTGLPNWDKALGGGLWPGLNIVAGSQGMGKSTLLNTLCGLWTTAGLRGFIASTEMTPGQWATRVWAYLARVRADELMYGNYAPALRDVVAESYQSVRASQHHWSVDGAPSVESLRPLILELVANKSIDFVMIDSATNMVAPGVSGNIYDQTKAVINRITALSREVQTLAGADTPIPFVVSIQTNSTTVANRAVKVATMLDAYGGQVASQDATTYTTVNYHTWFVDRNLAKPDDNYPPGVAALVVDKNRFAARASSKPVRVRLVEGMGFYADNVPPPVVPVARSISPRQYKDDDMPDYLYPNAISEPVQNVPF